jgi:hypothetical protein
MSWEKLLSFLEHYVLDLIISEFGFKCLVVIVGVLGLQVVLSILPKTGALYSGAKIFLIVSILPCIYEFGFKYIMYAIRPTAVSIIFIFAVSAIFHSKFIVYPAKKTPPPK